MGVVCASLLPFIVSGEKYYLPTTNNTAALSTIVTSPFT